jgi:hypothetical protein
MALNFDTYCSTTYCFRLPAYGDAPYQDEMRCFMQCVDTALNGLAVGQIDIFCNNCLCVPNSNELKLCTGFNVTCYSCCSGGCVGAIVSVKEADLTTFVHCLGNDTVCGTKTFPSKPVFSDGICTSCMQYNTTLTFHNGTTNTIYVCCAGQIANVPVPINNNDVAIKCYVDNCTSNCGAMYLTKASNLSDLNCATTARSNLGLGSLALCNSIDISADTNLAAGSGIVLTGDCLTVVPNEILHCGLGSLQGGCTGEYYHLKSAECTGLTSGSSTTLHYHDTDRCRDNHTGTQCITTITGHDKTCHDALSINATCLNGYSINQNLCTGNCPTFAGMYSTAKVGICDSSPNEALTLDGAISLKQQGGAPTCCASYGKVYTCNNTLFFLASDGSVSNLSGGGGGSLPPICDHAIVYGDTASGCWCATQAFCVDPVCCVCTSLCVCSSVGFKAPELRATTCIYGNLSGTATCAVGVCSPLTLTCLCVCRTDAVASPVISASVTGANMFSGPQIGIYSCVSPSNGYAGASLYAISACVNSCGEAACQANAGICAVGCMYAAAGCGCAYGGQFRAVNDSYAPICNKAYGVHAVGCANEINPSQTTDPVAYGIYAEGIAANAYSYSTPTKAYGIYAKATTSGGGCLCSWAGYFDGIVCSTGAIYSTCFCGCATCAGSTATVANLANGTYNYCTGSILMNAQCACCAANATTATDSACLGGYPLCSTGVCNTVPYNAAGTLTVTGGVTITGGAGIGLGLYVYRDAAVNYAFCAVNVGNNSLAICGCASNTTGCGVAGFGCTIGVLGITPAASAQGVAGCATGTSGIGVYGCSCGATSCGVVGCGTASGVYGYTVTASKAGVCGLAQGTASIGVAGTSSASDSGGIGVCGTACITGVCGYASHSSGFGIRGEVACGGACWAGHFAGNVCTVCTSCSGNFKLVSGGNYTSGDGTSGCTCCVAVCGCTFSFKNGLFVGTV